MTKGLLTDTPWICRRSVSTGWANCTPCGSARDRLATVKSTVRWVRPAIIDNRNSVTSLVTKRGSPEGRQYDSKRQPRPPDLPHARSTS
jgi:hypothetical protein